MRLTYIVAAASAAVLALSQNGIAQDSKRSDPLRVLDTLTVTGVADGTENVAGSITFIDAEELAVQGYSDVLRVLQSVPGVNIQEEEGYGLRPNIGLRGSGSDRNSRIVIMEDGVPIAPAVYSAPSAYYFPATARMSAVEVVKGPGVVQYGPRTTGGAIHLFSTPIPEEQAGRVELLFGDYGRQRLHANYGVRSEIANGIDAGFLIETYQDETDGFLERDEGGDTGFDVEDILIKAGLYGDDAPMPWALELKYQTKDEVSEQTYLGLTADDFVQNPYRLYASTGEDVMRNENELIQLTGRTDVSSSWSITGIAYSNEFARNWYKMQGVNANGTGTSGDVGLSSILDDPITYQAGYDLLRGVTSLDDSLVVRANNRSYYSRGGSIVLDGETVFGGLTHKLNAGIRIHSDEEDRFQKEDAYRLENNTMVLTTSGSAGATTNRVTSADALSLFLLDTVDVTDRLQVTAGLRYEDYEIERKDYSTSDPTRTAGPSNVRSASSDIILPSFAVLYDLTENVTLLGGIHKGFSPVGPTNSGAQDEEAWNYEIGGRYAKDALSVEAIAYFNDYSNMLGECTASTGGACNPGDAFNGGEVNVQGLEVTAQWDLASAFESGEMSYPVSLAYTYTDTEFQTGFESSFFGVVEAGDELNYVPDQQITFGIGAHADRWGADVRLNHVSETRGTIGSGSIPASDVIDARTLIDASAYFQVFESVRAKVKVENLFDESYIAARRPSGLRPGKPQEILFGIEIKF